MDDRPLELGLDTFGDISRGSDGSLQSDAQTIRNVVEQAVLQIDRQIEQKEPGHYFDPHRRRQKMEQPPVINLSNQGESDGPCRGENPGQQRIQQDHSDVARPPSPARNRPVPSRRPSFPESHQCEDGQEDSKPNHWLPGDELLGHSKNRGDRR